MPLEENNPSQPDIEKHTPLQSILLHLLPGILTGAVYFSLARPISRLGFPTITAFLLVGLLVLVPFELGLLLYLGRKSGARKLEGIVLYRQRLPWKQYLLWVPVIFLASGLLMTAMAPVSGIIEGLFTWIPQAVKLDMGLEGGFSRNILIITLLLNFLAATLLAPIVEELYFRGYLLPRMPDMGVWTPVVHSTLFALYHVWTPWMVPARILAVLPLIYIVRWKKNLYLGMIAHCLINSIDVVVGAAIILQMAN